MTREEFKNIVKAIRGAYINCPITSQSVFDEWYMLLSDMDYHTVSMNLKKHIQTNRFAPTVAELRNRLNPGFNNFTGRDYNMPLLELALLGIKQVNGIEKVKERIHG